MKSLGVIETYGLTSAIQAADAACKAASVEIAGYRKIGSGLVSVYFQGEISAVRTAVDHGASVISHQDLLKGTLVIARPDESVIAKLLSVTHESSESAQRIEKTEIVTPIVAQAESVITEEKVEQRKGKKS
ncbi:BMC domain-containing protein [Providencia rustigianii]|uniref:BMC domain-containing protein n=1 Tax=Providencia rustigianii TaxID=158850 RepID=UPI00223FB42D|nr:BMC domain-containing protein [Providencia rustigianii]